MRPSAKSRAKARAVSAERRDIRLALLAVRGPYCEACPGLRPGESPNAWSDVHEVLSRARGGSPTDPLNQMCLCRECHHWITVNPEEATRLGYLRARTAAEHTELFRIMAPRDLSPNGGIV